MADLVSASDAITKTFIVGRYEFQEFMRLHISVRVRADGNLINNAIVFLYNKTTEKTKSTLTLREIILSQEIFFKYGMMIVVAGMLAVMLNMVNSKGSISVTENELKMLHNSKLIFFPNEKVPDRFDARQKWPECTSIGRILNEGECDMNWVSQRETVKTLVDAKNARKKFVGHCFDGDFKQQIVYKEGKGKRV